MEAGYFRDGLLKNYFEIMDVWVAQLFRVGIGNRNPPLKRMGHPPARGDVNHDNAVNEMDVVYIINYVFTGGPVPIPYLHLGDTNCDGTVNVSDAVYISNYIWIDDAPPPMICYLNLPDV
jgi:hypothetical protein